MFSSFMDSRYGSKPSDYYYTLNKNLKPIFWSRITNKSINVGYLSHIDKSKIEPENQNDVLLKIYPQLVQFTKTLQKKQVALDKVKKEFQKYDKPQQKVDVPDYFVVVTNKRNIYNKYFKLVTLKELQRLKINVKNVTIATNDLLYTFYKYQVDKKSLGIEKLNLKIQSLGTCDYETYLAYIKEINTRRIEYQAELENLQRINLEIFQKLLTLPKSIGLLESLHIKSRKDLHKWLLIGHVDKGGDEDLCKRVLSEAKKMGFM